MLAALGFQREHTADPGEFAGTGIGVDPDALKLGAPRSMLPLC